MFTMEEVARATGGQLYDAAPGTVVTGVTVDSRAVEPGHLFVALPGQHTDGHHFAAEAVGRGAVAVLVQADRSMQGVLPRVVVAEDSLKALGRLAAWYRRRFRVPVAAVTGSVGKTTTKEMIASILSQRMPVLKSLGNYNTELGIPLTVFRWRPRHGAAVFELAMRAVGDIRYLSEIVRPQIGVITNVGPVHVESVGSMEAVSAGKAELVTSLPGDGTAVLNADDFRVREMAIHAPCRVLLYGTAPDARVRGGRPRREGRYAFSFHLETPRGGRRLKVPSPGTHLMSNALAAAAVALTLGLGLDDIESGLAAYTPAGSRMKVEELRGVTLLDDSYNAGPASVAAALRVLRQVAGGGRAVAVLADMLELGAVAVREHRRVGREAARQVDLLVAWGPLMAETVEAAREAGMEDNGALHFGEREELTAWLGGNLREGDTVLVKGSRGMAMEEVAIAIRRLLGPARADGAAGGRSG